MGDVTDKQQQQESVEDTPFERFQKLTRALFRVDKRDVPTHEPKRRATNSRPVK